jgi:branched-chain amino acid transport system substrate-binding protein
MTLKRRELLSFTGAAAAGGTLGFARRARAADPIKVGFTTALTGPFNEFGEGYKRGIEIAIEKINKAGGVLGRPIEIGVMLDDQLIPDRSVQNMRRILDDKSIVGLFCPSGSGPTLAVIDMIAADGRPTMNPQAQTPTVIYPNGPGGKPRPNVYTFSIQNDIEANFMATLLAKKFTRIGLLNESTGYGKTGSELIKAGIAAANKDAVVTNESYNQKDQDMTAQLVRVQRARSEALMVVGLGADMAVIRKNMTRMNMTIPFFTSAGGLSPPYVEGAGDLAAGTKGSQFKKISTVPPAPETKEFLDAYKAKYGADRLWGTDPEVPTPSMGGTVATGYDGMLVMADAIRRAGTTEAAAVIKAMDATKGFLGCNCAYEFTPEKHHAIEIGDLTTYEFVKKDGRMTLVPTAI